VRANVVIRFIRLKAGMKRLPMGAASLATRRRSRRRYCEQDDIEYRLGADWFERRDTE
jgi:hypothetical protein